MTVFGILWLCIIIWTFAKKDIKYMLATTLLFMTFQCVNVVEIGALGVGPQILTSIVFIAKAMIGYGGKFTYSRRLRILISASLLLVVVSIISCMQNGILVDKILYLIQLFIYVMCFVSINVCVNGVDGETLYKILREIAVFLLIMGFLQLFTTMGFLPLRSILRILFYNDSNGADYIFFYRNNYSRISSVFQEPSYFSGLLVGMFYYFLSYVHRWKENIFLLAIIFIELILTTSSTGYGAFLITGIIYILLNSNVKFSWKIAIIAISIVGFAAFYFSAYDLLDAVIFSKGESGSGITRRYMNVKAISAYEHSKIWGVGYKNIRGSSLFFSILGEMGSIGMAAYTFFNIVLLSPILFHKKKDRRIYENTIGVYFALVSVMACQMIACPDLELCSYWFWVYVVGIVNRYSFHE